MAEFIHFSLLVTSYDSHVTEGYSVRVGFAMVALAEGRNPIESFSLFVWLDWNLPNQHDKQKLISKLRRCYNPPASYLANGSPRRPADRGFISENHLCYKS